MPREKRPRKERALPAVAGAANATEAAMIEAKTLLHEARTLGFDYQFFKRDGMLVVRQEIARDEVEPEEALDGLGTIGTILKGLFNRAASADDDD